MPGFQVKTINREYQATRIKGLLLDLWPATPLECAGRRFAEGASSFSSNPSPPSQDAWLGRRELARPSGFVSF